jgi:hypothetical protein
MILIVGALLEIKSGDQACALQTCFNSQKKYFSIAAFKNNTHLFNHSKPEVLIVNLVQSELKKGVK